MRWERELLRWWTTIMGRPPAGDYSRCGRPGIWNGGAALLGGPVGRRRRSAMSTDQAHDGVLDQEQGKLAGDAPGRHDDRPGGGVGAEGDDQVQDGGGEHQSRPDE